MADMRKIIKFIIRVIAFVLGAVIFTGLIAAAFFLYFNTPPAFLPDRVSEQEGIALDQPLGAEFVSDDAEGVAAFFEVKRGESAQSVGQRLQQAGLIRNRYFWSLLCRYDTEPIKNGVYRIEFPQNLIAIHRILISGRQITLRVTIPEGLTLTKTARILENANICPARDFLDAASDPAIISRYHIPGESMEGYLYPDTYLFTPDYPASKVVQTMADTFFARIGEINERALSMTPDALNRLVILASIIEREYRLDEEAPLMAGVFFNRMDIGMALQSCATVEYIITEIQGKPHPKVLSTRDTEIRDPYNTYIRPGLPPGPISAPGEVALRAVFSPLASDYLYFRLIEPSSGRHYFSKTLDDHIKAGTLYVKGGS